MKFKDSKCTTMRLIDDFISDRLAYDYDLILHEVNYTIESLQRKELSLEGTLYDSSRFGFEDPWVIELLKKNLKFTNRELGIFSKLEHGEYNDNSHNIFELTMKCQGTDYRTTKVTIGYCETNEEFAIDVANSLTYNYLRNNDDPSFIKDKNEVLSVINKITEFLTEYVRNACEDVAEKTYDYLQTLLVKNP